jgi:hypothetical protein
LRGWDLKIEEVKRRLEKRMRKRKFCEGWDWRKDEDLEVKS